MFFFARDNAPFPCHTFRHEETDREDARRLGQPGEFVASHEDYEFDFGSQVYRRQNVCPSRSGDWFARFEFGEGEGPFLGRREQAFPQFLGQKFEGDRFIGDTFGRDLNTTPVGVIVSIELGPIVR